MAKINEGDVIEGIFTIALSLYIAYGKVDKNLLNKIRTQIDTKMFSTGRFMHKVVENHKRQKPNKLPDLFNVNFEMRLKPQSVQGAFDKEFQVLYSSSKDIGNIDKKIDQLIKAINTASFAKKANDAVNYFLDNKKSDIATFTVVADGIAGESSGGAIKGDVTLEVYATEKGVQKKIAGGSIPFSLKSESITVANLSPYNGMLNLAEAMHIKWDAKEKYKRLSKPFIGPTEQKAKFEMISSMYDELSDLILLQSKTVSFSKNAFDFLGKSIFGDDLADVVDVQSSAVKEITVSYFEMLKQNITLSVQRKGKNIVFTDSKTKVPIFKLRTKLIPRSNEAKFYLEVGKGIYAK